MRKRYFFAVATRAFALCVCFSFVGLATGQSQPDVKTMTMEALLVEFYQRPAKLTTCTPQRRIDVINALRKIGKPLIEKLKKDLKNPDTKVKKKALRVLMSLGEVTISAVPEILVTMNDADEDVRYYAILALTHLEDHRAFYALVKATRAPSPKVRLAALKFTRLCFSDALFAISVTALSDKDKSVRKEAIYRLKMLKDKRAVPFLLPLLEDTEIHHYEIRKGIKTANRNCDEVVSALEHILKNRFVIYSKGTQEDNDQKVEGWKQWGKEHGAKLVQKLYAEPQIDRYRRCR
jgi:HEAT repeat protein